MSLAESIAGVAPVVAGEPLIQVVVFGLFWPPTLLGTARRITVPIEFDLQRDDEHIPREGGLPLFDAFASNRSRCTSTPAST